MKTTRSLRAPLFALSTLLASTALASGPVTFQDLAETDGAGIDYRRTRSEHAALWEPFRTAPFFSFLELIDTPHKWRGAPGVALLDFDRDGDVDIYVTNGPGSSNSLYSNQLSETGTLAFVDLAGAAGVGAADHDSSGVCFGDTDNDGDPDLFVLSPWGPNRFFENNGDTTFNDLSAASGLSEDSVTSISCSFGDINGDGLLDVAVGNAYADMSTLLGIAGVPFELNVPNQLFLNTGGNVFVDVSISSGILDLKGFGPFDGSASITWAISMVDYDLDGDIDIVHADDQAGIPRTAQGGIDRAYIHVLENDGTGHFTDVTLERNMAHVGEWMGLSFGDVNGDGYMDLFGSNVGDYAITTNTPLDPVFGEFGFYELGLSSSRWFLGGPGGVFTDPGVGDIVATPFGWGTTMVDIENDGDTDIVYQGGMAIGPVVHFDNPGVLFENDGTGTFSWAEEAFAGSADHQRRAVHGVAAGDLNGDGFNDLVSVSNHNAQPSIPLVPYNVEYGSPFDNKLGYQSTFLPTETPGLTVNSGIEDNVNGTLAVEISSADNGNHWLKVRTLGTVGLTTDGTTNRDGIGAVVEVRTKRGTRTSRPVDGGSSFASQNSLELTFGLGRSHHGRVDVLWPGGTRNRLYFVRAGEQALFPEIPCSYDADWETTSDYVRCVKGALDELVAADVLSRRQRAHFFWSALLALYDQ